MNRKQIVALWVGVGLVILMVLFPPWLPMDYRKQGEAVEYAPIWYVPREIGLVRASPYWGEPEYHTWLPGKYGPYGVVALHWLGMQCAVVGIITGAAILSFGKPGNRETGGNRGGNRKPGKPGTGGNRGQATSFSGPAPSRQPFFPHR